MRWSRSRIRCGGGLPVATTTTSVAEYLTYWLNEVAKPSVRETTFVTYEGAVRLHIIPGIGKRKLKSLQPAHVRTWINGVDKICQCCAQGKDAKRAENPRLRAECCAKQKPECCGDVLSLPSIRHLLKVLRAALQSAMDKELLSRNVARLVKVRGSDQPKVRALTGVEAKKLLAAARDHRLFAL